MIPRGNLRLEVGDHLTLFTATSSSPDLAALLDDISPIVDEPVA